MEMSHSIEGRLPFLDHHVVELAVRMPVERLIKGTIEKYVLREATKPVLTETVYRRQKHPFLAPPASTVKGGALHELIQDTLRGVRFRDVPFFDQTRVVGLLDALPTFETDKLNAVDSALMLILTTAIMQHRFGIAA
jgi:asparagine synthase (glutamine-hydrolysing)